MLIILLFMCKHKPSVCDIDIDETEIHVSAVIKTWRRHLALRQIWTSICFYDEKGCYLSEFE